MPVLLVPVHAQMQPQDAYRAGAQGRVGKAKHTAGIQESPHPPGANANVIIHRQSSLGSINKKTTSNLHVAVTTGLVFEI